MADASEFSKLSCTAGDFGAHRPFTVLDIYRYVPDITFPAEAKKPSERDAFDVVISDGRVIRVKCLLHQSLNKFVYKRILQRDVVISITESAVYCSQNIVGAKPFLILKDLVVVENSAGKLPIYYVSELQETSDEPERTQVPLGSVRDYYLPLWNDEDYYGSVWDCKPDLTLRNRIDKIITLADLETFWKTLSDQYPAVVAKIVSKSRLHHFGKPSDTNARFPYEVYLEIEDRSAIASVRLLDSTCARLFKSLSVGDVIVIADYCVSRKIDQGSSSAVYSDKRSVQIEISVKPANPISKIYKLEEADMSPLWKIPDVSYRFVQKADLFSCLSGLICDITGVVTFFSSNMREKKRGMQGYRMYIWVHLQDGTSKYPIIVKIFACSQPDVLKAIKLGKVLVCTKMMLQVWTQNSNTRRHVNNVRENNQAYSHLVTTAQSQISVLCHTRDFEDIPFGSNVVVRDIIKWRTSSAVKGQVMEKSCFGGLYTFPPLPVSFKELSPGCLVDLVEVQNIFEEMQYQEHIRLHLKGIVVAVEHIPLSEVTEDNSEAECNTTYFPHVILDEDWWEQADKTPKLGNHSLPTGIPKVCSQRYGGAPKIPVAYQEGFGLVNSYWRLVLLDAHHPVTITVLFLPLQSKEADCMEKVHPDNDTSEENLDDTANLSNTSTAEGYPNDKKNASAHFSERDGTFIHALKHGIFPGSHSVKELLNIAAQDLKDQQLLFVLDACCHGQGEVDVLVSRAYEQGHCLLQG